MRDAGRDLTGRRETHLRIRLIIFVALKIVVVRGESVSKYGPAVKSPSTPLRLADPNASSFVTDDDYVSTRYEKLTIKVPSMIVTQVAWFGVIGTLYMVRLPGNACYISVVC